MKPLQIKDLLILLFLTAGAVAVHGYHFAIEDAAIYIPAVKRILDPELYRFDHFFFSSQTGVMFFDELTAWIVRLSTLSLESVAFLMHLVLIFVFLFGCLRLMRLIFPEPEAQWCGTALIAVLLTIPVAGTKLYIMDQHLHPRSFAIALFPLGISNLLAGRWIRSGLQMVFAALMHPMMAFFAGSFLVFLLLKRPRIGMGPSAPGLPVLSAAAVSEAPSAGWREAMLTRTHYSLFKWEWPEWLGIIGPFALLGCFAAVAKRTGNEMLRFVSVRTLLYGMTFFSAALVLSAVPALAKFSRMQPMRSLQMVYFVFFLLAGGLMGKHILRNRKVLWVLLFLPLSAGMFIAQRNTVPSGDHIEWPGMASQNRWVSAFDWVRENTPKDALFALDPYYMAVPGEDYQGFRAVSERSMLADHVKDAAVSALFPEIGVKWKEQADDLEGWKSFNKEDFLRLRSKYGVGWVIVEKSHRGVEGFSCPYENNAVRVCRIE